jgi:ubiquinone biosynthesis protein
MPTDRRPRFRIPGVDPSPGPLRQTRRLGDVLSVLVRHGFEDVVAGLRRERQPTLPRGPGVEGEAPPHPVTRPERIRALLEELGPTYVKLGQVLSTRPDLVPPDLLVELAKLQDRVAAFPYDQVRQIVEEELGRPPEAVFESFDAGPLASASLGQVHRARLDGQEVVVKVQRPGIQEAMEADIELMMQLAVRLERHVEGWAALQPTRAVKEFALTLAEELDYEVEAAHQERVANRFRDDPTVYVPRVVRGATTSRVLTMEFIDGIKVSDLGALRAANVDVGEVARRGFRFVLEQTLVDGFFHADPHPGNIFVLPDNVVCFIDFGMMGRLGASVREDFVELIYHVIDGNPARVTETVLRLTNADVATARPELERDVARFMDSYVGRPLREMDLSKLLGDILSALSRHGLHVPSDLFLMLKAITQVESVAVALVPDFDLVTEAEPYVRRVFLDRFRPRRVAEEALAVGHELALLLRDAPAAMRELSRLARGGGLRVGMHQEGMPEMLAASHNIANRIAFAFVLGACLVGSAIVAAAGIPPLWNGISILGLGGFIVALVMAFWLLVSILRHGRL